MKRSDNREDRTSGDELWLEVPDQVRQDVEWLEGRHGPAKARLPSLKEVPVPEILSQLPEPHPDRPRGSKAMLDAGGAQNRLATARPGAWLVSVLTGWRWAKWPSGDVGWVPKSTELPRVLRVDCRDDLQ